MKKEDFERDAQSGVEFNAITLWALHCGIDIEYRTHVERLYDGPYGKTGYSKRPRIIFRHGSRFMQLEDHTWPDLCRQIVNRREQIFSAVCMPDFPEGKVPHVSDLGKES